MSVLGDIEPRQVFRFFEEICKIPHGSGNTKQISDYLVAFADERGLRVIQDDMNNVVIFKNGTAGYENSASVIIQGHIDMVCEKDNGCDIDFNTEGLRLRVDGNVISAEGTTLGGDDGIAVAFALAILDAGEELPHPPIEAVFTVDEEIGMFGATALDCSVLSSKLMLNLDSEDEGKLLVSCAGGSSAICTIPVEYNSLTEESKKYIRRITVSGISGGHSGVEIIKQGANANRVLGRVLYNLRRDAGLDLIELNGGMKENVIPREAYAVVVLKGEDSVRAVEDRLAGFSDILKSEYEKTDSDIKVTLSDADSGYTKCMSGTSADRVIASIVGLPNGIQKMSNDIEGLVQTSLNLGIMKTDEGKVTLCYALRSSLESERGELEERIECLMNILGGSCTLRGSYPAWEYMKDSRLRDIMLDVYSDMFGGKPEIQAIHAGLECGIFAGKIQGLDCVSYGPQMDDIHTSSERLYIDSVVRTWNYTLEILKRLK